MVKNPLASVVICTRNRGELIVDTLETVLANSCPQFELLVVDQSTNLVTENVVKRYATDKRLRYIHTDTKGTGISRYIGLVEAKGLYVLYTDDDCTVSVDWVEIIANIFKNNLKTAVIYSNVAPGEHDKHLGAIPNHMYDKDSTIDTLPKYYKSIGMGAGMSVRRNAALKIGGFDKKLGPGSFFRSGEDHDIAVRALLKGWHVQETTKTTITHFGFRTFEQFKELTERDWVSMGAVYAKLLKSKHPSILLLILYNLFIRNFFIPLKMTLEWKKPQGFRRNIAFCQGFLAGLKFPVNNKEILYK